MMRQMGTSDPSSDTTDAGVEDSFAAFIQDVGTQENSLRSNAADYGSDVGETDDEDADNPQSYSADDKAQQIENLDPSIGKERGKQKCTCSYCGESGHSRTECNKLYPPFKHTCTKCRK